MVTRFSGTTASHLLVVGGAVWLGAYSATTSQIVDPLSLPVLAVLHNLTPLTMVCDMVRIDPADHRARTLVWSMTGLFLLPVLIAFSGWSGASLPAMLADQAPLPQAQRHRIGQPVLP